MKLLVNPTGWTEEERAREQSIRKRQADYLRGRDPDFLRFLAEAKQAFGGFADVEWNENAPDSDHGNEGTGTTGTV